MDIAQIFSGFAVGAMVGVTGVGGGALMTPLLVLLFGVAPATAVGTDLLYAAITKSGGTWVHARRGRVDWIIVRRLAAGSLPAALLTLLLVAKLVPGVLIGSHLAHRIPERLLRPTLAGMLVLAGGKLIAA